MFCSKTLIEQLFSIKDNDLAKKLQLQPKQVTTVLRELAAHHLVGTDAFQDKNDKGFKRESRQWYIDFKNFVDSVKLRMHYLKLLVQDKETLQVRYLCTNDSCQFEYTQFEMMQLMDFQTGVSSCKKCGSEIGETSNSATASAKNSNDSLSTKFDRQLKRISELLQETDKFVIPANPEGRRNYREIITKEQAQKRKYDEEKRYNMDKKLGGHSSSKGGSSGYGALGSTGHGSQLNQSRARGAADNDPSGVQIQVQKDEEEQDEMELEEEVPVETKKADTHPDSTPWFLDRRKNDIAKSNQINANDDTSSDMMDKNRVTALKRQEKMRTELVFNELLNSAIADEFSDDQSGGDEPVAETVVEPEPPVDEWMDADTEVVMVTVQGVPKNIKEITEEDQSRMTREEYADYYNKSGFADDFF
jgi:hypothetical protein